MKKTDESAAGVAASPQARARAGQAGKAQPAIPKPAGGKAPPQRAVGGATNTAAATKRSAEIPPLQAAMKSAGRKAVDAPKPPVASAAKASAAAVAPPPPIAVMPAVPVADAPGAALPPPPVPAAVRPPKPASARKPGGADKANTEPVVKAKEVAVGDASADDAPERKGSGTSSVLPLEAAVDAAMAALLDEDAGVQANDNDSEAEDQRAVTETFAAMAKVHSYPLRELIFQLSVGRTPRSWAAACRPVLRPLFEAATQIGLLELVGALGALDAALERAGAESGPHVGRAASDALIAAYERLHQQMPEAFAPPERSDSRRLMLLESLLLQVPSVQRRTLAKLYGAGISTLTQLCQATAEELAAVAGIDLAVAQAVVEHVQRFERERERDNPVAVHAQFLQRLRVVTQRLSQQQAEFERAEQEESAERKRAARRGREAAVLELELLFAELGDVELVEELRRCPVRGKLQRVESYLERMQSSV